MGNVLRICGLAFFVAASMALHADPAVVHSRIGTEARSADGGITLRLVDKRQSYSGAERSTYDAAISSPKSVNFHPSGKKFYVNSLEGGKTVVYSTGEPSERIKVIDHRFTAKDSPLWAPESGFYKFRHYHNNVNTFMGKPVESAFTHGGRYLWVPYYRRSFDINAQDPSAVAVIDTETDSIVRLMEAGVLPKMIAASPDGRMLAITHWGDNTVGLVDVSSPSPADWRHAGLVAVDKQIFWDLSLSVPRDRDVGSGNALRGTVFMPDGRHLLVGCMGGNGGVAVIDVDSMRCLGKLRGMMSNVRHLVISGDHLYLSVNGAGYVQRVPLDSVAEAIAVMDGGDRVLTGWESCKVGAGARTIELTPDGRYLFAACNNVSKIYVVDTRTMAVVTSIDVDSYPVGLDISGDGTMLIVTSQGKKGGGGNAVNIYRIMRPIDVSAVFSHVFNVGVGVSLMMSLII